MTLAALRLSEDRTAGTASTSNSQNVPSFLVAPLVFGASKRAIIDMCCLGGEAITNLSRIIVRTATNSHTQKVTAVEGR